MAEYASLLTVVKADISPFDKAFDQAKAKVKDFEKSVDSSEKTVVKMSNASKTAIAAVASAFAVAAATVGLFLNRALEGINTIDKLYDSSRKLGVGVEAFQKLQFAADRAGVSSESLESSISRLSAKLGKMQEKGQKSVLGLNIATLVNETPDQQYLKIALALSKITNQTERANEAQKLFGRNYKDTVGIINDGLENNITLAGKMGTALNASQVSIVHAAAESRDLLGSAFNSFFQHLSVEIAPVIKEFADFALESIERMGGLSKAAEAFGSALRAALWPVVKIAEGLLAVLERVVRVRNYIVATNSIDAVAANALSTGAQGTIAPGLDSLVGNTISGVNNQSISTAANSDVKLSKEFFKSTVLEAGDSLKDFTKQIEKTARTLDKIAGIGMKAGDSTGSDILTAYIDKMGKISALLNQGGEGYLEQAAAGKQLPQLQSDYFDQQVKDLLSGAQSGKLSQRDIQSRLAGLTDTANSELALNGTSWQGGELKDTGTNTGMLKAIDQLQKLLVDKKQDTIKVEVDVSVAPSKDFDIKAAAKARQVTEQMFADEARKVAR